MKHNEKHSNHLKTIKQHANTINTKREQQKQ